MARTTLATAAVCAGIGLHSGKRVRMALRPVQPGTGIEFVRTDLENAVIPALWDNVTATELGTTVSHDGASVQTIEHLMAALAALGVDDLRIEVNGPELPALDGSAELFVSLIKNAGVRRLAAPRRAIQVLKTIEVDLGQGRKGRLSPSDRWSISVAIDFDNPVIGAQNYAFDVTPEGFIKRVANARTFGFLQDVTALKARGLARGGSLANAVVIDGQDILNPEGLRYSDEFARHKALDALGDLYLAGAPIIGAYDAARPGHALNNAMLHALFADESAWRSVVLEAERPDEALAYAG